MTDARDPAAPRAPCCCRRCLVAGRVQGVSFRANTARQAASLGVTGYARNLADGRVEVLACGPQDAVESLQRWLARGPIFARVDDVHCEDADEVDPPPDFTTA